MPAEARGWTEKLKNGERVLRYRDLDGNLQRARTPTGRPMRFGSKTAALNHFRDVIAPQLRGEKPDKRQTTLRDFGEIWLAAHAATGVRKRTIDGLRDRLGYKRPHVKADRNAIAAFGDIPLCELEHMAAEIAGWRATLPTGWRYPAMRTLRQCLDAAERWDYIPKGSNPAKLAGPNPQPPPRPVRVYTLAELEEIAVNLSKPYRQLPAFAAATGLRPEEWIPLERRDIDKQAGVLNIRRTISGGEIVELGKTSKSRRQVPLSPRALQALEDTPRRIDTPLIFPNTEGGPIDLDNWRRDQWSPAISAGAIAKPARIYDLRDTFASNAIAARVDLFELATIMGTSVKMIERHYGKLLGGATEGIAGRLAAFEAAQEAQDTEADER